MVVIGIIGGTGLEDPNIFQEKTEVLVEKTPWGEAPQIFSGLIAGQKCYVLSRHGKKHDKSPTQGYYF